MDFKVHEKKDSPEKAIFRLGSGRTDFTFKKALAHLIAVNDFEVDKAKEALEELWRNEAENDSDEVELMALNDETRELFKYFAWYSDEKGAISFYCKLSDSTETYVLSRNLLDSAQAITFPDSAETVYAWMYRRYAKLVRTKRIAFYGAVLGNKKIFPDLQFYWERWSEQLWRKDPYFRLSHTPKGISVDPKEPCFFYFDKSQLKEGPTPSWDGWLTQFPKACVPIFKAWVYSIFDPKNKGRQAIWLHDNGYTGKSSVIQAITKYLGQDAAGSISGGSMKTNFAFEPLYGKRLVTYGDCKEPNLIRTPKIHSLLGNDYVTIDRKGMPAFTAKLHAKLLIASNIPPQIDFSANNERTRLLYIPLKEAPEEILSKYCKTDESGKVLRYRDGSPIVKGGRLTEELLEEMDEFIHSCKKDYDRLCVSGQDIVIDDSYLEMMKASCISEEVLKFQSICERYLEFDETKIDYNVSQNVLLKFYNGVTTGNTFKASGKSDFSRFKKYLFDIQGVKQDTKKIGPVKIEILTGLKLTEEGKDKADEWDE